MNTFKTLQALFLHDLTELQEIRKRRWLVLSITRIVKEEHLGRCCYMAEEFLSSAELDKLKHEVGLDERQWRTYKMKISGQ